MMRSAPAGNLIIPEVVLPGDPAMRFGHEAATSRRSWSKARRVAKTVGAQFTEKVLIAYFALNSPDTPTWAKAVLVPALGYFVMPFDAVPDVLPVVGYGDDALVLAAAIAAVAMHVSPEVKARARGKMADWGLA